MTKPLIALHFVGRLSNSVPTLSVSNADWIHVDVMDRHGAQHYNRASCGGSHSTHHALPLDVHLMIVSPTIMWKTS